ncbi:NnrS family protein [Thiohalobacter sp. IOR34]|uniref:NnrS family protein n=1 Tax=Thiohalobacter sp. IOR34 TaxID=3057176 RepID=UPI0025B0A416|nr:NnrS family protein [Thiohalobacter sp. IOR34]WJW75451.1 NnrS family protein [Thiohalobacter sp. IOR34]
MQIESPRPKTMPGLAPLALGFRPFFLVGGLAALVLLGLWLAVWGNLLPASGYYGAIGWHAHEMLFGYTAAVVAGFLLTAVRNWTGIGTPTGLPLGLLVLLWLLGRLLPFLAPAQGVLIAVVDLAFLPALALALARPLFGAEARHNRIMLLFLAGMILANVYIHLDALGWVEGLARQGQQLMLFMVLFLLMTIGGRVLPFFTEAAIPGAEAARRPAVEKATVGLALALVLAQAGYPEPRLIGVIATLLGLVQLVRLWGWFDRRALGIPVLWVLHSGYLWLGVGFLLLGAAGFGRFAPNLALHALTVGAIGVFTLGMMARVSLGHTGRMMQTAPAVNLGFVLLNLAALLRVFGPLLVSESYNLWVNLAGGLWLLAFALFVWVYTPILLRARVDGRPG